MILSILLRSVRWLVRKIGPLNLVYIVLFLLAVLSFCYGLSSIVSNLQTSRTLVSAIVCVLLAWTLAESRLQAWKVGLLGLGFSLTWLGLIIGRMYIPLSRLILTGGWLFIQTLMSLFVSLFQHQWIMPRLDFNPLAESWYKLLSAMAALTFRLGSWFTATRTGAALLDPLVTNLLWVGAVFLVVFWGAWFIQRRGAVIVGLLPEAIVLTYLMYYTNSMSGMVWLIPLAGLIVIFQAAEGYRSAWEHWLTEKMDRVELEAGFATVVIGLTSALMLAGGALPSISIREIQRDIRQYVQDRQSKHLPSTLGLRQYPGSASSEGGPLVLGPILRISSGPHLSQDVVLYVSVAGYHPPIVGVPVGMAGQLPPPIYYFRGQTYDLYTGFGWTAYPTSVENYPAGSSLSTFSSTAGSPSVRVIRQYVQRAGDQGGTLFVSGELITADQAFQVTWRGQGDQITSQTSALAYWADSSQASATTSRLRSAGADYPPAIRARYLQLPSTLPDRVRSLALDLTASQSTPYDAAVAIETYLRRYPYTLDVPAPPATRDAVDYFLFDLKKGYCDYYATAMTVLARAAGIPARLVVGYATGLFDPNRSQFVVTAADAHSWVEVYFPGIGWVEFEPTPNLPLITNPGEVETNLGVLPQAASKAGIEKGVAEVISLWYPRLSPYLIAASGILVLLLFLPIRRWILLLQPAEEAVAAIYRSLVHQGRPWGIMTNAACTPNEYAEDLLRVLCARPEGLSVVVRARIDADLTQLTDLYDRMAYSTHPVSAHDRWLAVQSWFRLRRRLRWLRFRDIVRRLGAYLRRGSRLRPASP